MLLPGVGEPGQMKLRNATAVVVGCGALGTHLADSLTRAGVGRLVVIDRDFVEPTNLQRQVLFDETDVAEALPKVEAARRKLERINSDVEITAIVDDVSHENVERFLLDSQGRPADVICDGLDNYETRYLLNDVAVKHAIPYVYGGAVGTSGMAYSILPHTFDGQSAWEAVGVATPCLRCIFEQAPAGGATATCDTVGVLGSTVAVVAAYEFNEAFKILTGNWAAACPYLQEFELWQNTVRQLNVAGAYAANECVCCKHRQFEYLDGKVASGGAVLCGRDAVQLRRAGDRSSVDLPALAERLRAVGNVRVNPFMLRAEVSDNGAAYELSVFADGRAIIKGTQDTALARTLYARYVGG